MLQVVTGHGETGAALCRAGVDKVAFTGSTATGKRVMAACAETLTPVVIEAGGKDALIVDADADVEAAADAAAVGRVRQRRPDLRRRRAGLRARAGVRRVPGEARSTSRGSCAPTTARAHLGPMTMPEQMDIIRSHIQDALDRGGRAVVGGVDAVGERFVQPTILVDVPEDSRECSEETFGPTVTVAKVRDMDEAVTLANGTRYGLGSTVFAKARGMEIAERICAPA